MLTLRYLTSGGLACGPGVWAVKLRDGIAKLGPVFVKMAQTLSTRPDIIGEEAANSLMVLQAGPGRSSVFVRV